MNYHKEFTKLISRVDNSRRTSDVVDDFLEMGMVAIANRFYHSQTLENSYLATAKNYSREQLNQFAELLAIVVAALNDNPCQDFLGVIYQEVGANESLGQFFTPYMLSKVNAEMILGLSNLDQIIAEKGYVTVIDSACGAGSLIIGFRNSLSDKRSYPEGNRGYEPDSMFATAIDIDKACFNMTYIQLSLLGIAGEVILGNSLTEEYRMRLHTPTTFLVPKFRHLPYSVSPSDDSTKLTDHPDSMPVSPTPIPKVSKVSNQTMPNQLSLFD